MDLAPRLALLLACSLLMACPDPGRSVGESCINDSQCASGLCFSTCLDPDRDADDDGLTNSAEKSLGTDPFDADTDGDGKPDGVEGTADQDGAGGIDALEPSNEDSDDDCKSDEVDATNDTYDPEPYIDIHCPQAAPCPEGVTPVCEELGIVAGCNLSEWQGCCDPDATGEAHVVYVAPGGAGTGSQGSPLGSLAEAIAFAESDPIKTEIRLLEGAYDGPIQLGAGDGPLTLVGGYTGCDFEPSGDTSVITTTGAPTVTVDPGADVTLRRLELSSTWDGAASSVAETVAVSGATARLEAVDVSTASSTAALARGLSLTDATVTVEGTQVAVSGSSPGVGIGGDGTLVVSRSTLLLGSRGAVLGVAGTDLDATIVNSQIVARASGTSAPQRPSS